MTDEVFDAVFGTPGGLNVHGSTFSGNLLAMTAGLAVLRTVRDRGLLAHARRAGERLASGLRQLCSETLGVTEIRGRGLLLGVRIRGRGTPNDPSGRVVCCQLLRERGVITTLAGHEQAYLKLTPPLTLSDAEIDLFLAALREAVGEITAATSDHVSA